MTAPNTPDIAEVEAIARKLTKAQREAVLGRRALSHGGGMWPLRNALNAKGLTAGFDDHWTPLGLAVRDYLKGQGS